MALPFLKHESEETATQMLAFVAICLITLGLMVMNVSGALASSVGMTPLAIIIRTALAVLLAGAEMLAAVALVRVMLAPNRLRKIIGSVIFLGLAWACIQNGKRAVHLVYPEFAESPAFLAAKASIAGAEAELAADARLKAIDATPQELERVRTEIADLRAEQALMASQSPEKIKEAQALLIAQGKYFGAVDGIRKDLTEAAMRGRGEEIAARLERLMIREDALSAGAVMVPAMDAGESPAVLKADLEDKARKAAAATIWLEVMLWVLEGARSFGLWVYVTTITAQTALIPGAMLKRDNDDATPEPERPATPAEDTAHPEAQAEAQAEAEAVAEPVAEAASGPEPEPDPEPAPRRFGDPGKGGASTAMNHEIRAIDDSIPVDPPARAAA